MSAPAQAAARLVAERATFAQAITEALYAERPHLLDKHGERGRARCLEDMNFNLEYLAPAVELQRPEMFAAYVTWLDGLLRARGIDTADVARSLVLTERVLGEHFAQDAMQAVLPSLHAGLAVLDGRVA